MTLEEFFGDHQKIALGFSGGVDSAYLLYAARKYGAQVGVYYVRSEFQPAFELEDAERLCRELGADMAVLSVSVLQCDKITENPADRCYYCKTQIFSHILDAALKDGYTELMDGTNASDEVGDRPGMRVLKELSVYSPLRLAGLTKQMIRDASKEAELFTWNKPAYACLATRIPTGERITEEKLQAVEKSESYLTALGFRDFRVRTQDGQARLEIRSEDLDRLVRERGNILNELKKYYRRVTLDLEVRK